jgi:glycerophosphoryl diester phosphodiesterase
MPKLLLPRLIGHRGAAGLAPENTVAGLVAAAGCGLTWVEVDVRLARDGGLVLLHDDTLERTTGARGRVRDMNLADIAALDAGGWFGPAFAGEPVPTLDGYLDRALDRGMGVNLEIKALPGDEVATAAALAQALRRRTRRPPLLVSSFLPTALAIMREDAPDVPRGFLRRRLQAGWRQALERIAASSFNLGARGLTQAAVAKARSAGVPVAVYTVNLPAEARRLVAWGVDSLFTDRPDLLRDL